MQFDEEKKKTYNALCIFHAKKENASLAAIQRGGRRLQ